MSRISVLAIAFSFMAGLGGWYWLSRSTNIAICDRAVTGLAPDAPLQLAAMLDRDCAIIYIGQSKDPARTAIDFGYPSLAYDYAPRSDVNAVLEAAVLEGDRGFFMSDPAILGLLGPGPVTDFVKTIFAPKTATTAASLHALTLWRSPENMAQLRNACETIGCTADKTICPTRVGLADKLRLVRGQATLATIAYICEISSDRERIEWIRALRRAGLLDTACTSTLQVTRIMRDNTRLAEPCFGPDFSIKTEPAGDNDLIRFIRRKGVGALDKETLDAFARLYPESAAFLAP